MKAVKTCLASIIALSLSACGGGSSSGTNQVNPESQNNLPVVSLSKFSVNEDSTLEGTIAASDSDNDSLTFSLTQPTNNGEVSLASDGSFTYQPSNNYFGDDTFSIEVTDGKSTVTSSIEISVLSINDAPTLSLSSITLDERLSSSIKASASDVDGSIETYLWEQVSGSELALSDITTSEVTVLAPTISSDEVTQLKVTVTDNDGESISETIDINLTNTHFESRLSGTASIAEQVEPNTNITLNYDDLVFSTTTDIDGNYNLDIAIPVAYKNKPYLLSANASSVDLTASGLIDELLQTNGKQANGKQANGKQANKVASTLSRDIQNTSNRVQINLNEVTSAETELLESLFSGETYLNEVLTSLKETYQQISSEKLLSIASFIIYMKDNNIEKPQPFTLEKLTELLEAYESSSESESFAESLAQNQTKIINGNTNTDDFSYIKSATFPFTIIPTRASAKNTVRLGGSKFAFVYRFESETNVTIINDDGLDYQATWSIDDDGILTISRAQPNGVYYSEGFTSTGYRAGCIEQSFSETWNILKKRNNAPDSVVINRVNTVTCKDGSNDENNQYIPVTLTPSADVQPFNKNDLLNKSYIIDLSGFGQIPRDNSLPLTLSFETETSGNVLENNESFTWSINSGVIEIELSSGKSFDVYNIKNDNRGAFEVTQLITSQNGAEYSKTGMMVEVDTKITLANDQLELNQWRSGFDISQPNEYRDFGFYLQFLENGEAFQQHRSTDGVFDATFTKDLTWSLKGGSLEVYTPYLLNENTRCSPQENNDCRWLQVRELSPLSQHGNRIYVKENIYYGGAYNGEFPPIVESRLNFYEVTAYSGVI